MGLSLAKAGQTGLNIFFFRHFLRLSCLVPRYINSSTLSIGMLFIVMKPGRMVLIIITLVFATLILKPVTSVYILTFVFLLSFYYDFMFIILNVLFFLLFSKVTVHMIDFCRFFLNFIAFVLVNTVQLYKCWYYFLLFVCLFVS